MPEVFLRRDSAITVGDGARVFGRADDGQRIFLDAATTDVRLDANIERIDLDRRLADLSFQVADDGLDIMADGNRVAAILSLNQATDLVTRDGDLTLEQVGASTFELTGQTGAMTRVDRDEPVSPAITPGAASLERPPVDGSAPAATVFLASGEMFRAREAAEIRGPGTGDATIALAADARDVRTDANITRLELPYAFDTVAMQVTDDGVELATTAGRLVTLPSLNQPAEIAFTDGAVILRQTGTGQFALTGANSTATLDRDGLTGELFPAARPGGDGAPTLQVDDAESVEGGSLVFDVTTTNLRPGAKVTYAVTPESASASDIRGALAGDVTVDPTNGRATVRVATADDTAVESSPETVTLAVDHSGSDAGDTATGTIRDNDDDAPRDPAAAVPGLDVADAAAREGGTLRFAVTSTDLPQGAEIDWQLGFDDAGDDAIAGATAGTVALNDGSAAITVALADDDRIETGGPETVELAATNRATGARATGTGEILDNDGAADIDELTVTSPSATEGADLVFEILAPATADVDRGFAWTLDLSNVPPAIVAGPTNGTVTIPAGATRAEIVVPTAADTAADGPDRVILELSDGDGTVLAQGTGTIRDDDPAPDVPVLTLADATATEGETLEIPFALSEPAPAETAIVGGLDAGRAGPGVDNGDFPGNEVFDTVTLAAGETNGVLRLPIADDDVVEGTETFGTSASSPDLAETEVRFGEATILDNDGGSTASALSATRDAADPMAL